MRINLEHVLKDYSIHICSTSCVELCEFNSFFREGGDFQSRGYFMSCGHYFVIVGVYFFSISFPFCEMQVS